MSIRRGNEKPAIPMLEEALQILAELPNLASSINTNAQLALAHFRLGDQAKALSYAQIVLDLAADIAPTVYSLHIGFSSIAQVYFELWERALQNPGQSADTQRYRKLAEKAIQLLRKFRNMVPIGQPFLAYYQGWHQWLSDKPQKAIQSWQKGLEAAQKFNTLYEEGLLRARLANVLKDTPDQQREHFERACQIFNEMDAARDLQTLKAFETKSS